MKRKVIADYFDTNIIFSVIFQAIMSKIVWFLLNVRIGCFSSSLMILNEESLGFGMMAEQQKQFEDDTVDFLKNIL